MTIYTYYTARICTLLQILAASYSISLGQYHPLVSERDTILTEAADTLLVISKNAIDHKKYFTYACLDSLQEEIIIYVDSLGKAQYPSHWAVSMLSNKEWEDVYAELQNPYFFKNYTVDLYMEMKHYIVFLDSKYEHFMQYLLDYSTETDKNFQYGESLNISDFCENATLLNDQAFFALRRSAYKPKFGDKNYALNFTFSQFHKEKYRPTVPGVARAITNLRDTVLAQAICGPIEQKPHYLAPQGDCLPDLDTNRVCSLYLLSPFLALDSCQKRLFVGRAGGERIAAYDLSGRLLYTFGERARHAAPQDGRADVSRAYIDSLLAQLAPVEGWGAGAQSIPSTNTALVTDPYNYFTRLDLAMHGASLIYQHLMYDATRDVLYRLYRLPAEECRFSSTRELEELAMQPLFDPMNYEAYKDSTLRRTTGIQAFDATTGELLLDVLVPPPADLVMVDGEGGLWTLAQPQKLGIKLRRYVLEGVPAQKP